MIKQLINEDDFLTDKKTGEIYHVRFAIASTEVKDKYLYIELVSLFYDTKRTLEDVTLGEVVAEFDYCYSAATFEPGLVLEKNGVKYIIQTAVKSETTRYALRLLVLKNMSNFLDTVHYDISTTELLKEYKIVGIEIDKEIKYFDEMELREVMESEMKPDREPALVLFVNN